MIDRGDGDTFIAALTLFISRSAAHWRNVGHTFGARGRRHHQPPAFNRVRSAECAEAACSACERAHRLKWACCQFVASLGSSILHSKSDNTATLHNRYKCGPLKFALPACSLPLSISHYCSLSISPSLPPTCPLSLPGPTRRVCFLYVYVNDTGCMFITVGPMKKL